MDGHLAWLAHPRCPDVVLIAAMALANGLPLDTANPSDFVGVDRRHHLVTFVTDLCG